MRLTELQQIIKERDSSPGIILVQETGINSRTGLINFTAMLNGSGYRWIDKSLALTDDAGFSSKELDTIRSHEISSGPQKTKKPPTFNGMGILIRNQLYGSASNATLRIANVYWPAGASQGDRLTEHKKEVQLLSELKEREMPTIIMGDTNAITKVTDRDPISGLGPQDDNLIESMLENGFSEPLNSTPSQRSTTIEALHESTAP